MSKKDVDAYLCDLPDAQRQTLESLRIKLLSLVPGATEGLSYSMPAVLLNGKVVAGYAAWKNHLAYYPHSGAVLPRLEKELGERKFTTGGFHFGNSENLSDELLRKLVDAKLEILREKYPNLEF